MRTDQMVIDHRRPTLTQILPSEFTTMQSPFTYEYSYYNCTGSTVILSLRNGLRLELKSEDNLTTSGFVIKVVYKFSKYTAERLCTHLANKDCPPDDPLYPFKVGLIDKPYKQGNRFIVVVDYNVKRKEFGMRGGSVYVSDADVLLTLADDIDAAPPHPCSEEHSRFTHGSEASDSSFVYKLVIVDNHKTVTSKYTNVNGEVFRIDPIKDLSRQDGLYRYCRKPHEPWSHDVHSYETYYQLSDLRKAGVFDTMDEATYAGNAEIKKQEELLHAEHQAQMKKYEAEAAKQESARVASILLVEANEQKHRQDIELILAKHKESLNAIKEEQKRLEMKDHYDERGYKRKDSSEFMKHLPVIILGVGTALAAAFAFF